jgi:pentatricopeptide repeat protein
MILPGFVERTLSALENKIDDPSIYRLMIEGNIKNGKLNYARSVFDIVIEFGKGDEGVYNAMIGGYVEAGEMKTARKIFERALSTGMAGSHTYRMMISGHLQRKDLKKAREVFELSANNESFDNKTYNMLRNAYYTRRRFGEIVELIDGFPIKIKQAPAIQLDKAEALRKMGKYRAAISFTKSLLEDDTLPEASVVRAKTIQAFSLKDNGSPAESLDLLVDIFQSVSTKSPHTPRIICGIVFSWQDTGFKSRIDRTSRDLLLNVLRVFAKKKNGNENLRGDIGRAIRIIEKYSDSQDSKLEAALVPALSN